ncbi:hypothetical protein [Pseudactinotalea sp.]|uniref:hypothetical protein n=1 Tax=Pseudactinotalea sp. TaxID=1926260 RepID=UPI003B3BA3A9
MRQPLLDAVRGLDPAAGAPEIDGDEMLARIRARAQGARRGDLAHLVPRTRSRPARRIAMGAAALSAITAIALVLTLTQSGPQAYASWVAQPTLVSAETAGAMCPAEDPGPPPIPLEPVLAERRGDYTFVVLAGDDVFWECLISTAGDDLYIAAQGAQSGVPGALELGTAPALVLVPGVTWAPQDSEGPVTTVMGRAGDDVTGIRVTTADGVSADAAVVDGWWSVWFPGDVELSDDLVVSRPSGESTYSLEGLLAPGLGLG